MRCEVVPLTRELLDGIMVVPLAMQQAYFSPGSLAFCLWADGQPVLAGGIVNMLWHRGEVWMLTTPWFKAHVKTCYRHIKQMIPELAKLGQFRRVQATCTMDTPNSLFYHLDFTYEGLMHSFGPKGEDCHMFARVF